MAALKFKELNVDNLFDFCDVLNAIGAEQVINAFDPNEIMALKGEENGEDGIKNVGVVIAMKIAGVLIRNIPKARNEVYTFLAGCMECDNGMDVTVEDIRKLKAIAFIKLVKDFFKQDGLSDFFEEAAGLMDMDKKDSKNCATDDTPTLMPI